MRKSCDVIMGFYSPHKAHLTHRMKCITPIACSLCACPWTSAHVYELHRKTSTLCNRRQHRRRHHPRRHHHDNDRRRHQSTTITHQPIASIRTTTYGYVCNGGETCRWLKRRPAQNPSWPTESRALSRLSMHGPTAISSTQLLQCTRPAQDTWHSKTN